jgi:uncharacterized membrane protein HdeD (DUF308 family)
MGMITGYQIPRHAWWVFLLRGIVAILFGLMALIWPHLTLLALILLFGAYALVDGLVLVAIALQERSVASRWWILLLEGLLGVVIGVLTFFWPGVTALVLLYLIVFWAILTGIGELAAAFSLQRSLGLEWTLAIGGVLSILLGILLAFRPAAGLLTVVWLIGVYAIVAGVLLLVRAFQFRSLLQSF